MTQIFTSRNLPSGQVFEFYSLDSILHVDDTIEVWSEKERGGLGDPVVYGKARVIETPYHPSHLYKAMILSGEN